MAIDIKEPAVKAPWPPTEENDPLYRYPKPYPVGRAKGESFFTIAKKHHLGASDLVNYNFRTKNSSEINWYLANYVGCPTPKHGQRYYELAGASYDPLKNTGVIFIPMHGETTSNALNRFGEKLVENYNNTTNKEPGGLCYETCYNRVKVGARAVGVTIPAWNNGSTFSIIWGTLIAQKGWEDVPGRVQGPRRRRRHGLGRPRHAGRPAGDLAGRSRAGRCHPGVGKRGRLRECQGRQVGVRPFVHLPELHLLRLGDHRHGHRRPGLRGRRAAPQERMGRLDRRQPLQEAGHAGEQAQPVMSC
jgi:hypothetical protein